jgi:AAA+ superfamily predicted ATPase
MQDNPQGSNAANLEAAMAVLVRLIRARLLGKDIAPGGEIQLAFFDDGSPFGGFIRDRTPGFDAYVAITLTLCPHLRPGLLETEFRDALSRAGDFPELGGSRDEASRSFMPTGETLAFLLGGQDLTGRFHVQRLLEPDGWLATEGLVRLDPPRDGAPVLSGRLVMDREWVARLTTGVQETPAFGPGFPARRLTSAMTWDDLVLPEDTRQRLSQLADWVRHAPTLRRDWGMEGRLRPGFRALFHGPPGTGKTLTATLIGQMTGREVFRIDLSAVVSKYIGETEKNLSALFDRAARRDWVLFFDEADALFGKRTQVKESHDRYANQEVSYLLQRVEDFDGLVILATNLKGNIDEAFLRRFNAVIRFPLPDAEHRLQLWLRHLPDRPGHADFARELAGYELSGGNITNIVQAAAIASLAKGADAISRADAVAAIAAEMEKEGRVFRPLADQS